MRIKWDQFCSCTSCKSRLNHEGHWRYRLFLVTFDHLEYQSSIIPCSLFNGAVAIRAKTSKRKRVSKTSRARTVCGNIHMWKKTLWIIKNGLSLSSKKRWRDPKNLVSGGWWVLSMFHILNMAAFEPVKHLYRTGRFPWRPCLLGLLYPDMSPNLQFIKWIHYINYTIYKNMCIYSIN